MINAIIMASGSSYRMGTNKLLLPYKGKPLISHTIELVLSCPFSDALLVGSDDSVIDIARISGIRTIKNTDASKGQSETIKLGIKNTPKATGYAFFTGDQPLLDIKTVKALMNCFLSNPDRIIIPRYREKSGNPVIFSSLFKEDLLNLEGDIGGRGIIKANPGSLVFVEVKDELLLWDIDTPEDYEKLLLKN